jgi:hypothetical protein
MTGILHYDAALGIAKDALIEFQDSLTLVDFMFMDMDPHQQTSIILGKPFLKSVKATIDKTRGIINMKVDGIHEKFIYHPKNLTYCCQMRRGPTKAHEKSPSIMKQKATKCYDTR